MDEMFKQTEIGLLPEDWEIRNLSDTVSYIDYGLSEAIPKDQDFDGVKIVSTADITRSGKLLYSQIRRVIANERIIKRLTLINGDVLFNWRNSPELIGKTTVYSEQTEKHIFASFILRIGCDEIQMHNYYLSLLLNYYREKGVFVKLSRRAVNQANYNRNEISVLKIPVPEIKEQKKIAYILTIIQKAIEKQEQIIKTTQELKKALMQKLFTEGLNGEEQKETEIGLIPQSWEVKTVKEIYVFTKKPRGLSINGEEMVPFVPMEYVPLEGVEINNYISKQFADIPSGTYFENGDLLLAKITPSFENGKQCIANISSSFGYATTEVIPIKEISGVSNKYFLFYYLLTNEIRGMLAEKMEGSTGRQRLPKSVLESLKIPFPKYEVQVQIVEVFQKLSDKIFRTRKEIDILNDLFKTMLNQLMTGQIRVNDIELGIEELSPAD
jgi:type I restriction enzyme S subunit